MKVTNRRHAIILLLILIAIGGIVMYGGQKVSRAPRASLFVPPTIKGPSSPPPGYEPPR